MRRPESWLRSIDVVESLKDFLGDRCWSRFWLESCHRFRRPTHHSRRNSWGKLELNNAPLHGDRNCLRAVIGAELFHDVLDVNLDSLLGYEELLGNLTIPVPLSNLPENFNFPHAQTLRAHVLGKFQYRRGDRAPA